VVPHSANLSLVTHFAQHLLGAIPNAGPYLELSIEGPDYYPKKYGLYDPSLAIENGTLAAPTEPGWGVEVDENWLSRAGHLATVA